MLETYWVRNNFKFEMKKLEKENFEVIGSPIATCYSLLLELLENITPIIYLILSKLKKCLGTSK